MRVLDLFCGAGGASEGYRRAGYEVVGVDLRPQPHYPFRFIRYDAMVLLEAMARGWGPIRIQQHQQADFIFDARDYDFVHLSPPCQVHTRAKHLRDAQGGKPSEPDLVERSLELLGRSKVVWVMENVPGAPLPDPIVLCGSMFGLKVRRHRLFSSNIPLKAPGPCRHKEQGKPVGVYHAMGDTAQGMDRKTGRWVVGGSTARTLEEAQEAMGIDWMNWRELKLAIPPAYTEYLARWGW